MAVNDVQVDGPEAHLVAAADIAGAAVPGLDRGGQTGGMQFVQWVSCLHYQRPGNAAQRGVPADSCLGSLEVRQQRIEVPALGPGVFPGGIASPMPAGENHRVDGR